MRGRHPLDWCACCAAPSSRTSSQKWQALPRVEGMPRLVFPKGEAARLVRVEAQAVLPEPQREDAHKAVGIVLTLKEGHRIVCVAQDRTVASAMARHYRGKPLVEDRIQAHVGNDRGDDGALGAPQFVLHDTPWRLHPGFEHARDQPQALRIGDAPRKDSQDLRMGHRVEKLGTHLRRDTVIPQWFHASKAAAASDGQAVHC